ncbi:HNH endonuclease [Hymenobacter roseosalivarius DSM 11622]|uniref:HNH endonuclease n=1 Tax=Hymenobacter roseosalivarius DSM 11622 TaxID=645990 RepID=A0A1W1W0G1_9BACT|nr:HNH endonuclease [Hymenobacter roseosalivarius]SMB99109.1 HNH endonuclease [Hymenobacter roseosalivarius DSM 11622]
MTKTPQQKLTEDQTHKAYLIAKYVYENPKTKTIAQGAKELSSEHKVNFGTAKILIRVLQDLLSGLEFTRALNEYTMRYYLQNITLDYGLSARDRALMALMKHIIYRETGNKLTGRKPVKQIAMRLAYEEFLSDGDKYKGLAEDQIEQEKILKNLVNKNLINKSIKDEIRRMNGDETEIITITLSLYKRENRAVALIKLLRGAKCQMCGTGILKQDDSYYIEAAHITPKYMGGKETLENIIILCPNHHKEFDLGACKITHRDTKSIAFTLNGQHYNLSLD